MHISQHIAVLFLWLCLALIGGGHATYHVSYTFRDREGHEWFVDRNHPLPPDFYFKATPANRGL